MLLMTLQGNHDTVSTTKDPGDKLLTIRSHVHGHRLHVSTQQHHGWGKTWGLWSLLHPVQWPDHVVDAVSDIQLLARQVSRMVRRQVCCYAYFSLSVRACNGITRDVASAHQPHLSVPHIDLNLELLSHCMSEWLLDMLWVLWEPANHCYTLPDMLVSPKAAETWGCRLAMCCLRMLAAM